MALKDYRKFADDIINDYPQLENDINEAYNNLLNDIDNGESIREAKDMFYWYINKLKKEAQSD
jgi:hypothetical protein